MTRHHAAAIALLLLATACAPTPPRDQAPTIKTLETTPSVIVYEPKARIDKRVAIAAYRQLLSSPVDRGLRMEVMRRIADLQLSIAVEALELRQPVEQPLRRAQQLYEELLRTFPGYPEGDRILYNLARVYYQAALDEEALELLARLVRDYPDTFFHVEANFRRGEILFDLRRYAEAVQTYDAVIAGGDQTPLRVESLYKKGWALFAQGRYEAGLDALLMVLDNKLAPGGRFVKKESLRALDSDDRALVQDTLRAINMSFTYLEEQRSIAAYLNSRRQRPYDDLIYEALAQRYLDKERYSDAAATYATFVNLNPQHPEAPYYQIKVYEVYEDAGFRELAWPAKQDFIDRYGFKSPFWLNHDIRQYPRIVKELKQNLMDLAQHYHALAQASGDPAAFEPVARMYSEYLGLFPDDPDAPRLRFLLAELRYETGHFEEAIKEYEQTAYGYSRHERATEAGYAALMARYKIRDQLAPAQLAAWDEQIIASALQFTAHFPNHPESDAVLTRVAEDLFARNDQQRALELATRLTRRSPRPRGELLRTAYTIQGHIHFDRSEFDQAANAYEQALRLSAVDGQQAVIQERLAAVLYKLGENARDAGKPEQAVDYFLRIPPIAPPASPIAATALHDAAAALIAQEQWTKAITVLERFRGGYADHPLAGEVTRKLAYAYLQGGQPGKAAEEYLRIGTETEDPALKRETLWQAAQLYEETDQGETAMLAYQRYVVAFPLPLDAAQQARLRLAELNRKAGNIYQHRYWLREVIDADREAGRAGTDYSRQQAARASLHLAQALGTEFENIRLAVPLQDSLRIKKQAMESALAAYGEAVDYGFEDITTAATYALGELYHHLSRSLLDSQRPSGLSRMEREQYDILLEEEAYPFEEKAISLHESNLRNLQSGLYNQ
ncbi:MAG: tetratricopeptide repeat protein, partial [Gammaproteobacteria bacterium]